MHPIYPYLANLARTLITSYSWVQLNCISTLLEWLHAKNYMQCTAHLLYFTFLLPVSFLLCSFLFHSMLSIWSSLLLTQLGPPPNIYIKSATSNYLWLENMDFFCFVAGGNLLISSFVLRTRIGSNNIIKQAGKGGVRDHHCFQGGYIPGREHQSWGNTNLQRVSSWCFLQAGPQWAAKKMMCRSALGW